MAEREQILTKKIYLSLRIEKTRNSVLATVRYSISMIHQIYEVANGRVITFE